MENEIVTVKMTRELASSLNFAACLRQDDTLKMLATHLSIIERPDDQLMADIAYWVRQYVLACKAMDVTWSAAYQR